MLNAKSLTKKNYSKMWPLDHDHYVRGRYIGVYKDVNSLLISKITYHWIMTILVEAKGANEGLKTIRVGEEQNRTATGGTLDLDAMEIISWLIIQYFQQTCIIWKFRLFLKYEDWRYFYTYSIPVLSCTSLWNLRHSKNICIL